LDDPGGIARQAASELAQLRRRIAELEASESRQQAADNIDRQRAEGDILQRAQLSALGAAVGLALTLANSLAGALQECAEALVTFMDAAFARVWTLNERVQDIVNNLLNGLQLLHLEAEGHVPAETLELVERMIREAAVKLKTLGDLETVIEKDNGFGLGIDYPGSTL